MFVYTAELNEERFQMVLFISSDVDICRRKIQFVQECSATCHHGTREVFKLGDNEDLQAEPV